MSEGKFEGRNSKSEANPNEKNSNENAIFRYAWHSACDRCNARRGEDTAPYHDGEGRARCSHRAANQARSDRVHCALSYVLGVLTGSSSLRKQFRKRTSWQSAGKFPCARWRFRGQRRSRKQIPRTSRLATR